ncbi:hypothetical protein M409DRAFT_71507 [Zasmidium cellare ATCC 36951]|uniref:Manganese/iron superoxide dismutase C-terminal domain-containing protein n=1 Tax=Zasmidium cellare ATCC 36951 TaxID=1080233 RepID=A0A6A6BZ71_ZASCE|nr:uncharacterized protein M409DRAFT_71507 [Zasmidium cellare ATCC 36951]KAF2158716.1 hypothetical protein M409DRAFT_71507 [Zasmidium cellare ATCC 36951]
MRQRFHAPPTMITRRLLRPAGQIASSQWTCSACRARAPLLQTVQRSQTRPISSQYEPVTHGVPILHHDKFFAEKGIPGLFSPKGYDVAWTQYQEVLLSKLRELTSGTPDAHAEVKDLVIRYARDPMNASLFNHASAAFNNHFFFQTLSTHPVLLEKQPQLQDSLINTFGSIETLRATMLDTAAAMFGPGYVWLVWARQVDKAPMRARNGAWRILTTYLSGTPFPEAGYRQQGVDMNNQNPNSYQGYLAQQSQLPNNTAGAFGAHSGIGRKEATIPPGGVSLAPVLCVSTWEHTWMADFGIAGKRKYLNQWWDVVDWNAVANFAPTEATASHMFQLRS